MCVSKRAKTILAINCFDIIGVTDFGAVHWLPESLRPVQKQDLGGSLLAWVDRRKTLGIFGFYGGHGRCCYEKKKKIVMTNAWRLSRNEYLAPR